MHTPADLKPELFQSKETIETPALVVDLDIMESNIDDFVTFAREQEVVLRSHTKTHKTPDIAHLQTELTNGGIVCQTLSECEVMAHCGIEDIYLSYIVVEESKLHRLAWLSSKVESFATTVDGVENADLLQRVAEERDVEIDAMLEINCGYDRTGIDAGQPAVDMATHIENLGNVNLAGVMIYEAHVKGNVDSREELERKCLEVADDVEQTIDRIEAQGIALKDVIAGGTATSKFTGKHPVVTEIKPGKYPFNDLLEMEYRGWAVDETDCAVTVLSTVISKPSATRAITNAGSKSISMDTDLMPVSKGGEGIDYTDYSEEHGWLEVDDSGRTIDVGDRIEFIPPHVCGTMNLHDTLVGVRGDQVEDVWEIQSRGKVR